MDSTRSSSPSVAVNSVSATIQYENPSRYHFYLITQFVMVWLLGSTVTESFVTTAKKYGAEKFFIYLTNWNLVGTALLLPHVMSLAYICGVSRNADERANKIKKWQDLTAWPVNILAAMSLAVAVLYWGGGIFFERESSGSIFLDLCRHGLSICLFFINIVVNQLPYDISSWKAVGKMARLNLIIPISYAIFACIYSLSGGTNKVGAHYIYPFLDWIKKPVQAAFVSVGGIALFPTSALFIGYVNKTLQSTVVPKITECWQSVRQRTSNAFSQLRWNVFFNRGAEAVEFFENAKAVGSP